MAVAELSLAAFGCVWEGEPVVWLLFLLLKIKLVPSKTIPHRGNLSTPWDYIKKHQPAAWAAYAGGWPPARIAIGVLQQDHDTIGGGA